MTEKENESTSNAEAPLVTSPARRVAARRLLRAEVVYVAGLMGFALLAVLAHIYAYFGWDLIASRALQNLPVPGLFEFMRAVSFAGDRWIPWILTTTTVILFFIFGRRSEAAGLILSVGAGTLLNSLLKIVIARPRPEAGLVTVFRALDTRSFPSGHVTFYVCYFGFLFFVAFALLPRGSTARRAALTLTALPLLLIGFSRVYLGAHWPSDTIGAYLSSGLWLAFSLNMYRRWKERATFHGEEKAGAKQQV